MASIDEITEQLSNTKINGKVHKKNRIQVSNTKKPIFFYVNLAKKYLQQYGEIELSALGMAAGTVISISEILKNSGFALVKNIVTSTVEVIEESSGRTVSKAKLEISMEKSKTFDEVTARANLKKMNGGALDTNARV